MLQTKKRSNNKANSEFYFNETAKNCGYRARTYRKVILKQAFKRINMSPIDGWTCRKHQAMQTAFGGQWLLSVQKTFGAPKSCENCWGRPLYQDRKVSALTHSVSYGAGRPEMLPQTRRNVQKGNVAALHQKITYSPKKNHCRQQRAKADLCGIYSNARGSAFTCHFLVQSFHAM